MNDNSNNEPTREAADSSAPSEALGEPNPADKRKHQHDLISRGATVIDKGRRGAKHDVTVKGRTVIDHRSEDQ